jgi:hypothetical protein
MDKQHQLYIDSTEKWKSLMLVSMHECDGDIRECEEAIKNIEQKIDLTKQLREITRERINLGVQEFNDWAKETGADPMEMV